MILSSLDRFRDTGLLILRLGVGIGIAAFHGWGKITGGPEAWTGLGGTVELIGIDFLPTFWGFLSAFAEFVGGVLVVLGFLFRPALILLVLNMAMASTMHIVTGRGGPEMSLIYGIVFLSLFLIGPGRYSVDAYFSRQHAYAHGPY